ncbi:VOC family protein [Mucilaginibacter sp. Mucisp86]|uniref:VOC family protein n=1 Tax=Mucilaginibacter sp. Mucisp86 TaxID=3243060 RepID=UPI0039B5B2B7
MNQPSIAGIAPFFIVHSVTVALDFYSEKLGFEAVFKEPADDPFFAIVQRDEAMIFLKSVDAAPLPNHKRSPDARWDAYVSVPNPDILAAEFESRGATFTIPLQDTHDGLRGFELEDTDGYILFFGRPR